MQVNAGGLLAARYPGEMAVRTYLIIDFSSFSYFFAEAVQE